MTTTQNLSPASLGWLRYIDANHPDPKATVPAEAKSYAALASRGLVTVMPTGRLYPTEAGQKVIDENVATVIDYTPSGRAYIRTEN